MVAIPSFWEDASYYMDTLNIMHSTRDRLVSAGPGSAGSRANHREQAAKLGMNLG